MQTKRAIGQFPRWSVVALTLIAATGCGRSGSVPSGLEQGDPFPIVLGMTGSTDSSLPDGKPVYTLAASAYVGWMPWYYAHDAGVLAKWARREGIEIEFVSMEYVATIEAFVTGRADACLVTNVDALGLPVAAGIDTTVLILGDYSNGNDKILTRGIDSVAGLRGVEISLVELSVSDYLLSRALEKSGLSQRDVQLANTGDSKIGAEFLADTHRRAVVTWNPIASELERAPGVRSVFDSGQIPGEILDLCIVNTETLHRDPRLGRALVGAWYEVLALMQRPDARGQAALAKMAELAGCSVAEFQTQLKTTAMFWEPAAAVAYAESAELQRNMEPVRQFCFAKNFMGDNVHDVGEVGIAYPDGTVQGRNESIRLRFDVSFVKQAE